MNGLIKIKQILFSKQFICFLIIGCINSLSGIVFSWIYSNILGPILAFIPGYITGIVVSYFLNSIFTFKDAFSVDKFIKFSISTIPNFLIQLVTVFIIVNLWGQNKLVAYILAAIIGVPVTFIILKLFVFIKK